MMPPDPVAGPAVATNPRRGLGVRYAILFSGMSERRHLNGLEFCYRTLLDRFRFDAAHIHVLAYDGSLATVDESAEEALRAVWPGDGTPYRMRVTGEGSRDAFRGTLGTLAHKLTADDQLFINTVGHGGNLNDGRGPYLIAYPHDRHYRMLDFCADLAILPPHRALLMLMAQCFSGGFSKPVLEASRAKLIFFAAAAAAQEHSNAVPGDAAWDSFERNWIAALAHHDVNGVAVTPWQPDLNDERRVCVREAFEYANHPAVRNPLDSPEFAANCAAAGDLDLWPEVPAG